MAITGTFTTGAAETTKVLNLGYTPAQVTLVKADGSLMAEYVAGVTVASVKGTFAATFTVGAVDVGSDGISGNDYIGLTFGGLANSTAYNYVIVR